MDSFLKTGKVGAFKPAAKGKKSDKAKSAPVPWVEKYRPKTVTDVAYQDQVRLFSRSEFLTFKVTISRLWMS